MATYYPPAGFHFAVKLANSQNDNDSRFQSVAGLTVEYDTESYKEGGENRFEHTLPVRTKYPDLVLKRGFLTENSDFHKWCNQAFFERKFELADIVVTLLNDQHKPIKTWNITGAWAKKWSVSDFNAETNALVIESIEIRYQYFTII